MPLATVRSALLAVLILAATGAAVAGCGGSTAVASTAAEAHARGLAAFEARRWDRAIEHFRAALDFGRTGELAPDAQLMLARSYAADRQYLLAGTEFTRFIEFYRTDPRVQQASFERIETYAAQSPSFELDQTPTLTAIRYIDAFVRQYPADAHVADAEVLRGTLREKLARKQYEAGRLYERRELYEAAALSYEAVLTDYPGSVYADDALLGQIRAQIDYAAGSVRARQNERYQTALRLYDRFLAVFPASPLVAEAEGLYDRAYRGAAATGDVPAATAPSAAAGQ